MSQTARTLAIETAAMGLGIVLDKQQTMTAAELPYPFGIGTTAIEMNDHDRPCARREMALYLLIIDGQRVGPWFHQHRHQPVLGDSEDRGDERVGRHDHLVALVHQAHLDIGAIDERERVETVAHTHTVARTDVRGIALFEAAHLVAQQIPARLSHAQQCLAYLVAMHAVHPL